MEVNYKKVCKSCLAFLLAICLVVTLFERYVPKSEVQAAETRVKTYTLELNGTSLLYLCNAAASNGPVTLEYTVESMEASEANAGWQGGIVATTNPNQPYPYVNGSIKLGAWNAVLSQGETYRITLGEDENGVTYSGVDAELNGYVNTAATGSQYYGIYIQPSLTGKLTNVCCYDAEGNDLGVQIGNGDNAKLDGKDPIKEEDPDCEKHTVELDGTSQLYLCNATASNGPITLMYTVESVAASEANAGWSGGVVATTKPKQSSPYMNGSYKMSGWNSVMESGKTYKITIGVGKDGMVTYSGNVTGLTDAGGDGAKDSSYYGIYIQPSLTGKLTNVCCYDAEGNDLGVQIGYGKNVKLDGEAVDKPKKVTQKTPEELGYERVVLKDFGLSDGTYPEAVAPYNGVYKGDSLNKKYLDVDVESKPTTLGIHDGAFITFAGTDAGGWLGVRIVRQADKFLIWATDAEYENEVVEISLSQVKMKSEDTSYNMKVGVQLSGKEVIVDFWINDIRVPRMTFGKGANLHFGTYMGILAKDVDFTLTTPGNQTNTKPEKLPDFKMITLGNFGIEDGIYEDTFVEGGYAFRLNKKIFSVDVQFGAPGGCIRYGSMNTGWAGLNFYTRNGNMYMQGLGYTDNGVEAVTDLYLFNAIGAGVKLEETPYNLKISTEYVDSDLDGKKDDVKLGVWFNDKLYENTYIYLQDYVQYLGQLLGIYSPTRIEYVKVSSVEGIDTGVDYSYFGFTKDWRKELGLE